MDVKSILPIETIAMALGALRSNKFRSMLTVLVSSSASQPSWLWRPS
jgi:hypothetical protein